MFLSKNLDQIREHIPTNVPRSMLGSVGDEGGAAGSGVELRMDESRKELGITHCKRDVFLNM